MAILNRGVHDTASLCTQRCNKECCFLNPKIKSWGFHQPLTFMVWGSPL